MPNSDPPSSGAIAPETEPAGATLATPTIIAITLTPLPTFPADELEAAVAELLANPMNCDVPCWWGAKPSVTTVFEVQQFLNLHQLTDYRHNENQVPDYIELFIGFDGEQFDYRVMYSFESHILNSLLVSHSPPPFEVLRKYGQPDEVWLSTISFERETLPVRLNMVYIQAGMGVSYTVDGDIEDNLVIGCYADKESGRLDLIRPNRATNYGAFRGIFPPDFRYLRLEDATELTMEDFMQRFSDPTDPQCIETQAELWE
jgi:hypothetical protein